jgi:hypothetical protein
MSKNKNLVNTCATMKAKVSAYVYAFFERRFISRVVIIICVFDCEEGGPSFNAAIPGAYVPLGLCHAEAPDLMWAMLPGLSKSSVCPDNFTLPNFPFT